MVGKMQYVKLTGNISRSKIYPPNSHVFLRGESKMAMSETPIFFSVVVRQAGVSAPQPSPYYTHSRRHQHHQKEGAPRALKPGGRRRWWVGRRGRPRSSNAVTRHAAPPHSRSRHKWGLRRARSPALPPPL